LSKPAWWTATAKAKAVAGIVLGMQFAHSLGLIHGCLRASNIVFDEDHNVKIADFGFNRLMDSNFDPRHGAGGFAGECWTPQPDIVAFASILSEIAFGSSDGRMSPDQCPPEYVTEIIAAAESVESVAAWSFTAAFEELEKFGFAITDDVDDGEVCEWVDAIRGHGRTH
jgi:serine/threonine protein kinase